MAAENLSLINFPQANLVETTQLSADFASGVSSITVLNGDNYSTDDFIIIGRAGSEQCELIRINSVSGSTISLTSNTSFAHKQFEDVSKLYGNQIRVYQAVNVDGKTPSDGSFSLIATVSIQSDQPTTSYTAATGGSGYWWKQTFYNSVSFTESDLSASTAVRGGDFGHYATLEQIRLEAGFKNNPAITDQMITDRRDDAEALVNGALTNAGYTLPLSCIPYIPPIVANATKLLTSGYLLLQHYGSGANGTNKDGNEKLKLGQDLLAAIVSRQAPVLDQVGVPVEATTRIDGWPDDTTATTDPTLGGAGTAFTMSMKL